MKKLISIGLILGSSLLASSALASSSWEKLNAVDFSVSNPPQQGDLADQADLREMLALQSHRTAAQCKEIEAMGSAKFKDLFKNSGLLSDSEYKNVKPLMKETAELAHSISKEFKEHFQRARPAQEDSRIHPCDDSSKSSDYSYPSSHATVATTVSCVLATVFPDRARSFSEFAKTVGKMRVLGGMHHPTDIRAGEELGNEICERLLEDTDYREALKDLAAE